MDYDRAKLNPSPSYNHSNHSSDILTNHSAEVSQPSRAGAFRSPADQQPLQPPENPDMQVVSGAHVSLPGSRFDSLLQRLRRLLRLPMPRLRLLLVAQDIEEALARVLHAVRGACQRRADGQEAFPQAVIVVHAEAGQPGAHGILHR